MTSDDRGGPPSSPAVYYGLEDGPQGSQAGTYVAVWGGRMTSPYQRDLRAAQSRLVALLDPQTPKEHATAAWLLDWDLDTIQALASMIERGRQP